MKNLSRFDISMIVAFVVIALVGGGAAYYLDAFQLAAAQTDAQNANDEFQKYSSKEVYLPTAQNLKILQGNIDLMKTQIDPLVKSYLQAPGNKLADVVNENTVQWKHDLDANVAQLNAAAKVHGIQVADNYYYGFSSYLNAAPGEESTGVLTKQLLAVEQMATIMINAPVNSIQSIKRTPEEGTIGINTTGTKGGGGDYISGHSVEVAGGIYTAYPFEITFDASNDALCKVVNGLMQSPYVFIIRSVVVQNSQPTSPQLGDLDKIAGAGTQAAAPSVTESPGAVAAATSTAGPQYLFGGETLLVQMRIDLIEWKGLPAATANAGGNPAGTGRAGGNSTANPPAPNGNR